MITAANGASVSAIKIFSLTLRYFRDHAIQELRDATGTKIDGEDIRWVITVPAIWRQQAKQFMREASYQVSLSQYSSITTVRGAAGCCGLHFMASNCQTMRLITVMRVIRCS